MLASYLLFVATVTSSPQDLTESLRRVHNLDQIRRVTNGQLSPGALGSAPKVLSKFEQGTLTFEELQLEASALQIPVIADDAFVPVRTTELRRTSRFTASDEFGSAWKLQSALQGVATSSVVASLADERVFVPVNFESVEQSDFYFTRGGDPIHTVGELGGLELAAGEVVWMHHRDAASQRWEDGRETWLCGAVVNFGYKEDGAPQVVIFKLESTLAQTPIVWNQQRKAYSTTISLVAQSVASTIANPGDFPTPLEIPIGAEGIGARVEVPGSPGRMRLAIRRLGPLPETVVLESPNHEASQIALVTTIDGQVSRHGSAIHAAAASIELIPSSLSVPAFGLGTFELRLQRLAEDGTPLSAGAAASATLTGSGVTTLRPSATLEFEAQSATSSPIALRSGDPGTATFSARLGALTSAPVQIRFALPWVMLIVSALGGALGGALRRRPAKAPAEDHERSAVTSRVLVGVAVGLVGNIALLSGLVVLDTVPPQSAATTAGCLVMGVVFGVMGRGTIDKLRSLVVPSSGSTAGE